MLINKFMSKRGLLGFSLVELIIIIVIIGILAAIAIPRVSRGSRGAGESALVANLAVLRNALELYSSEHNGVYPGAVADGAGGGANNEAALISQLTKYSNADGVVSDTRDETHTFGPYLRKGIPPVPVGANQGNTTVLIDNINAPPKVNEGTGKGWAYNPSTGDIIANTDDMNEVGDTAYHEY
jgi:general secretion pathway protein G